MGPDDRIVAEDVEEAEEADDIGRDASTLANTTAVADAKVAATGDLKEVWGGERNAKPETYAMKNSFLKKGKGTRSLT